MSEDGGKKLDLKWKVLALGMPVLVWLDLYTKVLIDRRFEPGERLPVIDGVFDLFYARNRGAAFGLFNGLSPDMSRIFFFVVSAVAFAVLAFLFWNIRRRQLFLGVTVTLIFSGAVGNFVDRARLGYVIDFLDFYVGRHHWPTFNVADICISVGATLLVIYSLFLEPKDSASELPESPPDSGEPQPAGGS